MPTDEGRRRQILAEQYRQVEEERQRELEERKQKALEEMRRKPHGFPTKKATK